MKWGLDFVGPIKPTKNIHGTNIFLFAIDYVTKWVEVRALRTNIVTIITNKLYECILTRFKCPLTIITDQGVHFINDAIEYLTDHFLLKHVSFTTYYPKGDGQVESSNKVFGTLLTKLVGENRTNWDEHLYTMLFSYTTIYKITWYTPYRLVYGLHELMPIEYMVPITGGNERHNISIKVLINKMTKLEKL
jgi:hypothetical protein